MKFKSSVHAIGFLILQMKKKKKMGSRDWLKVKGESVEEKGSKSLSRDPDSEHCVSSY